MPPYHYHTVHSRVFYPICYYDGFWNGFCNIFCDGYCDGFCDGVCDAFGDCHAGVVAVLAYISLP